jgi:hypothetical protein
MISAELKRQYHLLGSWAKVADEVGLCDRKIRAIVNNPGAAARVSQRTRYEIERARERSQPFPLVEHMRLAREAMLPLKQRPGSEDLRKRIVEIEGMLQDYRPPSLWAAASRCYLLAFTAMSRGLHHNNQHNWFGGPLAWRQAMSDAEKWCAEGRRIIARKELDMNEDELPMISRLEYGLFNNWLIAIAGQAKFKLGRSREETERILRDADAIKALKSFLKENPFLWQSAWNGLEIASTLKGDDEEMLFFYNELKRLDSGFQSFDYSPGEVPAISQEPGMAFFCERFRNRLHIDNPKPRRKGR